MFMRHVDPLLSSSFFIHIEYTNGNVNELQNVGESPRKSSLFFLTVSKLYGVTTLESDQPEIGLNGWKSTLSLEVSGVLSTTLEN